MYGGVLRGSRFCLWLLARINEMVLACAIIRANKIEEIVVDRLRGVATFKLLLLGIFYEIHSIIELTLNLKQ
jgi:hypothetical protein